MARNLGVTNAGSGQSCEGRAERCQKFCFQLAVNFTDFVALCDITADIGVEADRIAHSEAVFAEALDRDIDIKTDVLVDDAERNR